MTVVIFLFSFLHHDRKIKDILIIIAYTWLEGLDGDRGGVVPDSLPDLPELSVSELLDELEAVPVNLPLVPRVVAQVCRHWLLNLERKI